MSILKEEVKKKMLKGYVVHPSVDASFIVDVYDVDVCGNQKGNYCEDRPDIQIVSTQIVSSKNLLFIARLFGRLEVYPIPIIDGKVVVGNKQELTGYNPNISSDNMKEFGLTGMLVNDDYIFTAVTTINKELKTGIAKITRISYTVDENSPQSVILNNETDIYVREDFDIIANAHNLHLGCFTKLGDKDRTFLIVPFGDLNKALKYCYNESVD